MRDGSFSGKRRCAETEKPDKRGDKTREEFEHALLQRAHVRAGKSETERCALAFRVNPVG